MSVLPKDIQIGDLASLIYAGRILQKSPVEIAEAIYKTDYRKQSEWISVKDRLPEENGSYLVIGKSGTPHTAHFYKERTIHEKTISAHFSNRYVTHWMPLPEPPKGGAE